MIIASANGYQLVTNQVITQLDRAQFYSRMVVFGGFSLSTLVLGGLLASEKNTIFVKNMTTSPVEIQYTYQSESAMHCRLDGYEQLFPLCYVSRLNNVCTVVGNNKICASERDLHDVLYCMKRVLKFNQLYDGLYDFNLDRCCHDFYSQQCYVVAFNICIYNQRNLQGLKLSSWSNLSIDLYEIQ